MKNKKIIIVGVFIAIIALFLSFDLGQYLNLAYVKSQQEAINNYYAENSIQTAVIFFISYVVVTAV
ncbi:MAG: TVP38/TMEM64 family protein, partial [Gammaproteobacteria bacterium]